MKRIVTAIVLNAVFLANLAALDLNLADYISLVEENSKDLYQADIDTELAAAQEKLARSATLPMVSGSAGYARNLIEIKTPVAAYVQNTGVTGSNMPVEYADVPYNSNNDFSVGIGLEQLLFDMTVFKALEASQQYRDMTGTIYEATRQGILTGAKQIYYQTVLAEEVYKVRQATEQNAYETYQDVLKKYQNEIASELEVLQAEVNWQINIPETTLAARNKNLALSNLKLLAGLKPEDEVILTESLTIIPQSTSSAELGDVLSSRPDYQALQGAISLNEINVSAVKAEFYPTLSATASYGWQKSDDDFKFDDGTDAMQVGVALTIPIFYGGSRFAKMEEARLELEKSRVNLMQKQDDIRTELSNIQMMLDEASSRISSAETTLKTAERAYNITEVSSRNGLGTQLDLKDARLNLSGAQLNYYSATYDYLDAYFQWQQAIGQGDRLPF